MKFLFASLLAVCSITNTFAQKQGNQWYFNNAGLDFNTIPPTPILTSQMGTPEGSASIADKTTGQLLFYTDGVRAYDRTNTIMANSYPMGGDASTTQSAVIVPRPGSNTLYYVFTLDAEAGNYYHSGDSGLNVNVIDMSLNGGLGGITTRDSLLLEPTTEKCATTLACNGTDVWLVVHLWRSDAFYAYLVTPNGIQAPVISHAGIYLYSKQNIAVSYEAIGYMRISTDGKKLALVNNYKLSTMQLFDFNNANGTVSNAVTDTGFPGVTGPYGVCFSPHNSRLYISSNGVSGSNIYQYNMLAGNDSAIIASRVGVEKALANGLGAIQRGPDGKIYVATDKDSLDVIANPDSLGAACNYVVNGISLGGKSAALGLPDIIPNYNRLPLFDSGAVQPQSSTICSGQSVLLTATGGSSYNWAPATGLNSLTGDSVIASPTANSTYVLTGTSANGCLFIDSAFVAIRASDTLKVTANPDSICNGQNSTLSIVTGSGTFQWSPASGLIDSTSSTIIVSPTLTTVYTVSQPGNACTSAGQITLTVANNAVGGKVTTLRDTICYGTEGNLILTGNSNNTVQWQSSVNDSTYTNLAGDTILNYKTSPLTQSTWYHAILGKGHCMATSDSLQLIVPPVLIANFSSTQTSNDAFTFNSDSSSGNILSYHWNFGDGQTSTEKNPTHTYAKDTTYYVCLTLYDGSNCSYTFCRYNSIVEAIPFATASGNWIIYPNPFSEQLTISSKQMNGSLKSIEIYDMPGQLVMNENPAGTTNTNLQLDVSALAKGMYFIMIRTTNADYVQKVVKQ